MIEVGKVVTKSEKNWDHSYYHPNRRATYENTDIEWVTIQVGAEGVALELARKEDRTSWLALTPEQAIEIAQLLMKAAESQSEYAAARNELVAEMNKLDESFKDRISGLGINHVTEPETSVKSAISHKSGSVIIVEVE